MSELREAIARAICAARGTNCAEVHVCDKTPICRCPYWRSEIEQADAALAAIEARGMVVVPADPDSEALWDMPTHPVEAMGKAFKETGRSGICGQTNDAVWRSKYAPERAAYRAMIAAARKEDSPTSSPPSPAPPQGS